MVEIPNTVFGLLALIIVTLGGVVLRIYLQNIGLYKRIDELHEARRVDAVESRTEVTSMLPGIAQSLQNISDKIEISNSSRRR